MGCDKKGIGEVVNQLTGYLLISNYIMKDFTTLETWKLAHELMLDIYTMIKLLPSEEKYNLIDQIRRSSSSVPANIAEGYGRYYYQDNISFCRKARGSLLETKNHLLAIRSLKYIDATLSNTLITKSENLAKLLNGYIRHLNNLEPGK